MSRTAESPALTAMGGHSVLDERIEEEGSIRGPKGAYTARSPRKVAKWSGTPNRVNVGGG